MKKRETIQPEAEEAEEVRDFREIGRERRQRAMEEAAQRFSGLGGRFKNAFRRIRRGGEVALDVGFAMPEITRAGARGVEAGARGVGRKVEAGARGIGRGAEAGVIGAGRGIRRGAERGAAAGITAAIESGRFLESKYEGMKGFVRKRVEAIQERGMQIKEGFLAKIEEIRANRDKAKELRRRRKLDEMVKALDVGIKEDEGILKAVELRRKEKQERREAVQRELDELRGIVELSSKLKAESVSAE